MTQDEKLLLQDLSGRLPYGVKCTVYDDTDIHKLSGVVYEGNPSGELYFEELDWKEFDGFVHVEYCKPYLFPLSSMTEKQMEELEKLCNMYVPDDDYHPYAYKGIEVMYKHVLSDSFKFNFNTAVIDWFLQNHFDINELIPKGLAIDATGLNLY